MCICYCIEVRYYLVIMGKNGSVEKFLEEDKEENGKFIFKVGLLCVRCCMDIGCIILLNLSVIIIIRMRCGYFYLKVRRLRFRGEVFLWDYIISKL